jgi:hypothetical protein
MRTGPTWPLEWEERKMFEWGSSWDSFGNHNGAPKDYVIKILKTANNKWIDGDQGIKEMLESESSEITIMKGIHQKSDLHITIMYFGEQYHVSVKSGASGDRVGGITKRPFGY